MAPIIAAQVDTDPVLRERNRVQGQSFLYTSATRVDGVVGGSRSVSASGSDIGDHTAEERTQQGRVAPPNTLSNTIGNGHGAELSLMPVSSSVGKKSASGSMALPVFPPSAVNRVLTQIDTVTGVASNTQIEINTVKSSGKGSKKGKGKYGRDKSGPIGSKEAVSTDLVNIVTPARAARSPSSTSSKHSVSSPLALQDWQPERIPCEWVESTLPTYFRGFRPTRVVKYKFQQPQLPKTCKYFPARPLFPYHDLSVLAEPVAELAVTHSPPLGGEPTTPSSPTSSEEEDHHEEVKWEDEDISTKQRNKAASRKIAPSSKNINGPAQLGEFPTLHSVEIRETQLDFGIQVFDRTSRDESVTLTVTGGPHVISHIIRMNGRKRPNLGKELVGKVVLMDYPFTRFGLVKSWLNAKNNADRHKDEFSYINKFLSKHGIRANEKKWESALLYEVQPIRDDGSLEVPGPAQDRKVRLVEMVGEVPLSVLLARNVSPNLMADAVARSSGAANGGKTGAKDKSSSGAKASAKGKGGAVSSSKGPPSEDFSPLLDPDMQLAIRFEKLSHNFLHLKNLAALFFENKNETAQLVRAALCCEHPEYDVLRERILTVPGSEPPTFLMADANSPVFGFAGVPNKRDPNLIDFVLPAGWTAYKARQHEKEIKSVIEKCANQQYWFTAHEIVQTYPQLFKFMNVFTSIAGSVKLSTPERTVEEIGLNFMFVETQPWLKDSEGKPHKIEHGLPG